MGYEEVMQSWGDLFVVQQAHWGQKIAVTGVLHSNRRTHSVCDASQESGGT